MKNLVLNRDEKYTPSERLKKVSFYVLLFFCIFIPFRNPIADLTFSGIKAVTDLLIIAVFLWYSAEIRLRYKFCLHDILFLVFLLHAFISTVFINKNGLGVYIYQVRSIGAYYLFYFVIRNFGYGKDELLKTLRVLHIVSAVLFALGFVEKVTLKTLLFPESISSSILYASNYTRVYSMFYNPNTYGLFITLTLFLTWTARVFFDKKTNIVFHMILIASLWFTMSRSSLIMMCITAAAFLVMLIVTKKIKELWPSIIKSSALILVAVLVLNVAAYALSSAYYEYVIKPGGQNLLAGKSIGLSFIDRLDDISENEMIESSNSNGRLFSVKTSLKIVKEYPIWGAGFGSFGSAASLNRDSAVKEKYGLSKAFYSDIEYAKLLGENGILGTAIFLAFLAAILVKNRKNSFKLLLCFIIGWFGLFFNIFEVQIGAMLFWSLLGFENFKMSLSGEKPPLQGADK